MNKIICVPLLCCDSYGPDGDQSIQCRKIPGGKSISDNYFRLDSTSARVGQIIIFGSSAHPVFVDTKIYLRNAEKGIKDWDYIGYDAPKVQGGVIRRKTKIAKLLKQLP